jgi:hypothetical protein
MGGIPVAKPRINYEASIRMLVHDVRVTRANLAAQMARLDRIEFDLVSLLQACAPFEVKGCVSGPVSVAHNLAVWRRSDGSVEVSIDGGAKFSLGPRLADVFLFLASGGKDTSGKDPLVAWRSREDILRFLQDGSSRSFRRSYVNNMVHLLKEALRKAGYDRSLIQTHRGKGIRLAFKSGSQDLSAVLSSRA